MCTLNGRTDGCVAITEAGGIEHVVRAMAGHLRDGNVQEAGCTVLFVVGKRNIGE